MEVTNNEKNNEKMLGGITGKGFMPGVSGNPSGRPKNTMKDYIVRKFNKMTDEEKEQWLIDNKISGIDMWKMGEGNPKQDTDVTSDGNELQFAIINYGQTNNSAVELSSEGLPVTIPESTPEV